METINTEIIVHTNKFASFDIELCAFITGLVFEKDNPAWEGVAEAAQFHTEVEPEMAHSFKDSLRLHPSYDYKYTIKVPTPGWFNHGLGQAYKDVPESSATALADYLKRVQSGSLMSDTQANLLKEAKTLAEPKKFPSYQGVKMVFNKRLSWAQINLLLSRSILFASTRELEIVAFDVKHDVFVN